MARNRITLTIADEDYTFVSDESIAYVTQIGCEVDAAIRELTEDGRMSAQKAAVLVAVNEHDKLSKAEDAVDRLREQLQRYCAENETLRVENERLRRGY